MQSSECLESIDGIPPLWQDQQKEIHKRTLSL
jgi:hypothetical protein